MNSALATTESPKAVLSRHNSFHSLRSFSSDEMLDSHVYVDRHGSSSSLASVGMFGVSRASE